MAINYAHDKIRRALGSMAASPSSVKERLKACCMEISGPMVTRSIPAEFKADFEQLMARVTTVDAHQGEGRIAATIEAMSEEEAIQVIEALDYLEYQMGIIKNRNNA